MKGKTLVSLSILLSLVAVCRVVLGFFPWHLGAALEVSASLGAKLACSAHFISGFDKQRISDDLASYSPATRLLEIEYTSDAVVADMLGLATMSATYRPGLGCTLDIGGKAQLADIVPRVIPQGQGPWPLGEATPNINLDLQTLVSDLVEQDNLASLDTRALVVIKNGKLVAEAYGPDIDAQTPLLGWSMGKSITAIMLGRMESMGLLKPSQSNLFAHWQGDERHNITLEHLLQMSSGLEFDETYAPGSDSTRMLFNAFSASDVALASAPGHIPGRHFSYSSGTSNLLMRYAFERLSADGMSGTEFLTQQVFAPLAMASAVFEPDPSGIYVGSSYIFATGRDWARLGLLMVNGGEVNGQRLLAKDWVTRAHSPNTSQNDGRYGYQFWLNRGRDNEGLRWNGLPEDAYFMLGNRKQYVMIVPSQQAVIVRLGWTTGSYPAEENFSRILNQLSH